jgi:hypothetical protein
MALALKENIICGARQQAKYKPVVRKCHRVRAFEDEKQKDMH